MVCDVTQHLSTIIQAWRVMLNNCRSNLAKIEVVDPVFMNDIDYHVQISQLLVMCIFMVW